MIKVLLVDDHALFRSGVRAELEGHVDLVGEAGTVAEAVEQAGLVSPDVVLLDVHLPDGNGAQVIEQAPGPKYLALSVSDAPDDVIAVIRAGARGYVTKTISGDELVAAITTINDGDAVFSPRLAGFVLDAFSREEPAAAAPAEPVDDGDLDQLTPREREVLQHIARGYLYKEIALRLGISVKTVEAHVSAVLRKLQLSTRHELTRWAWERLEPPGEGKARW
jgi:DNA-binding NarL/FixJ family response regulator